MSIYLTTRPSIASKPAPSNGRWLVVIAAILAIAITATILPTKETTAVESAAAPVAPAIETAAAPTSESVRTDELNATFTNTLGMKFAKLPAGTFMMGSPASEVGRDGDEAQHRVTLSRPFYMGVYEVTQEEWQRVMGNNPSHSEGDRNPVENVSWEYCQEFIAKLNSQYKDALTQQLGSGWEYSFPTEAEWEYACRAGTTGAYGGSGDLDAMGWYDKNSGSCTHVVAAKKPNSWGLYDMHGNVWEWCQDSCNWDDLGRREGVQTDTYTDGVKDPVCTNGADRVNRGGSWNYSAAYCRSADRSGNDPSLWFNNLGLRLTVRQVK